MNLGLENKTVFISASSRGIGKAIARSFLEEGARAIINGRDEAHLREAYDELQRTSSSVEYIAGDVTDTQALLRLADDVVARVGAPDILVANLGNGKAHGSDALSPDEWRRFFEINVYSALNLIRGFLPAMKEKKSGSIVLVSSIAGIERTRAPLGYAAAKSSLLTLVKNLSVELAEHGIRINAVVPGNIFFKGGRWEEILSAHPEVKTDYIEKEVPLKRFGTPEEVASAVTFLASPISSFTTGTYLIVDGGETKTY